MSPICQVNIHRPECQQWRIKVYAKCRDHFRRNAPNEFSMWTPAFRRDMDIMTPADCHKLKRELSWELSDTEEDSYGHVIALGVVLAVTIIVVLLILLCGMKRRTITNANAAEPQTEKQEAPVETPQVKEKKKLNFKRCLLHSEVQARRQELKTEKQVAVQAERSQRKLAAWTKARERNAQKKKENLDRKIQKEYDRIHQNTQQKLSTAKMVVNTS